MSSVASATLRPRAGSSAKALLLTVLGELVLPSGRLGVDGHDRRVPGSPRRRGEERPAGHRPLGRRTASSPASGSGAACAGTSRPPARDLLTTGTERIYAFGAPGGARWDAHWLVVLCPVPEEHRAKRHHLRARLGFAGFGFLSAGVAISPHLEREELASAVLRELGLVDGAAVLRARCR